MKICTECKRIMESEHDTTYVCPECWKELTSSEIKTSKCESCLTEDMPIKVCRYCLTELQEYGEDDYADID